MLITQEPVIDVGNKIMFSKKLKVIIAGIITAFLLFALFFIFKNRNSDAENKAKESEAAANLFAELKSNHPEFSASQLEFYRNLAAKEDIISCIGRKDENDCIASAAFLKGSNNICGEIADEKIKIECSAAILSKKAISEIDRCQSLTGDSYINCLKNIFAVYKKSEDCLNLKFEKVQQECESVFYYNESFARRDTEICKKIKDGKLDRYCVENINNIDKILDSDSDGLTDYEERDIYKTDPNKNDTDGDGFSDGIEIRNGYNPLGQ